MNAFRIIKVVYYHYLRTFHPVKYARKKGVNMLGRVHIYGKINWSTEPWIITLGDNVHLTNDIRFITHDGGTLLFRDRVPDLEITKPITLGNNVYVGVNTAFLPGVHVGNNVVIGACSVVTKDIPDNSVAVGNPARVIKTIDEYFEKLKRESLHLGHLSAKEKDKALRKYYGNIL